MGKTYARTHHQGLEVVQGAGRFLFLGRAAPTLEKKEGCLGAALGGRADAALHYCSAEFADVALLNVAD